MRFIKRVLILVTVACLALMMSANVIAAGGVTMTAKKGSEKGTTVVEIKLDNPGLTKLTVVLVYDNSLLEVQNIKQGYIFPYASTGDIDGELSFTYRSDENISESGTLATVTFESLANVDISANITARVDYTKDRSGASPTVDGVTIPLSVTAPDPDPNDPSMNQTPEDISVSTDNADDDSQEIVDIVDDPIVTDQTEETTKETTKATTKKTSKTTKKTTNKTTEKTTTEAEKTSNPETTTTPEITTEPTAASDPADSSDVTSESDQMSEPVVTSSPDQPSETQPLDSQDMASDTQESEISLDSLPAASQREGMASKGTIAVALSLIHI